MTKKNYEETELYRIRHSSAHVMAQTVMEMFPGEAKLAIGPPIADGFYYDFDLPRSLTPEDLELIESRMREIIDGDFKFETRVVSAEEAREIFEGQPYKLELIEGLEGGGVDEYGEPTEAAPEITVYTHDTFIDLCRGPHLERTGQINPAALKLLNVAGAYWRGDEKRPMLQRIYGTAWKTNEELEHHLWKLEEAKKRDHRVLGRELDLFSISEDVGPGLILWHPKGAMVRKLAEDFSREEHEKAGYDFVYTPHIGKAQLWETSGHLDWFADAMYPPLEIEQQKYYLKPMNCPFHIQIYKSKTRSYRDLPVRYAEWGTVYRYERSGTLHGLLRVRGLTQDDAHLFCRPDQMPEEIDRTLEFSLHILRSFGFDQIHAYLATRDPEKAAGDPAQWEAPTQALQDSLERSGLPYQIEEAEATFYGPKIDLKVKDALDREWQLSTIQFDFFLPERFGLAYVGKDGQEHQPYMIHRALMGAMERFFGTLIEHHAGAFPVWLAPVQVILIPIADRHVEYAQGVADQLREAGLRIELDDRSERMNAKIRDAQLQKVPYMLVMGDREIEVGQVSVRLRSEENLGAMSIEGFLERAKTDIEEKK
ncbi:MAG: threonine--tRNA ligase [Chloroflexi bacterium]|nr:threonine--tRNA ligase [Chloroflexota bacterium]MCI0773360.1 threonine--tRNA ligase [Chloroflexota bacterium]MCI0806452.1 threonine--tRNA ligase [Chloroflexota bacterium]MCI0827595.1 threonine--tRNA ligase [Chloroflexota bacterium]MCI0854037.1 threonine--tRNA ligase [Chloroflexota bacterium]